MSRLNPVLMNLAQRRIWGDAFREKAAFQPPGGAGGAPPPGAMGGGMPPTDPAAGGGGAPPPAAPGGMPPGMSPGMPPPGMQPGMGMGMPAPQQAGSGKPKFDPMMLDYRMYNLQQQLSAIMAALNVQLPPGAVVMPPGTMGAPPAEQAMPGGPMDPNQQQGAQQGGPQQSAISPIEPMQGASPELAQAGAAGAGGAPKMAAAPLIEKTSAQKFAEALALDVPDRAPSYIGDPVSLPGEYSITQGAAAVAAMLRSRVLQDAA